MDIKTFDMAEVPPQILDDWRSICESSLAFGSPFFHPQFLQTVATVRAGVRVAVISDGDENIGFLPYEAGKSRHGRPVAAGLSDFQGIVCRQLPRLTPRELLQGCSLRSLAFDHWLADQQIASVCGDAVYASPFLDLSHGYDAFYRQRTAQGSTRFKKVGQLTRKLIRERGEVVFVERDDDKQAFDLLVRWKSQQYRRTGALDIFQYPWVQGILRKVAEVNAHGFAGQMMTYRVAGEIISVHLGMRTESTVHWWFPAYDPRFGKYSPGLLMLAAGAEYFAEKGVRRLDLGRGDEAFKRSLTLESQPVAEGVIDSSGLRRLVRGSGKVLWQTLRRIPGKTYVKRSTALMHRLGRHYKFR